MEFIRHTDPKEAMGLGRERIALKIYGISILLAGPDREWIKFRPTNSAYIHSVLSMINKNEISKSEILKLITGKFNEEQNPEKTNSFTQIKFELEYSQADLMELKQKGESEIKTVKYQLKLYEVVQGKTVLIP